MDSMFAKLCFLVSKFRYGKLLLGFVAIAISQRFQDAKSFKVSENLICENMD